MAERGRKRGKLRNAGAIFGVFWGLAALAWGSFLVYVTLIIKIDREFSGVQWMEMYTGVFIVASAVSIIAGILLLWKPRASIVAFFMASAVSLLAILPGYAFSWTGFSGFGTTFFLAFVMAPSVFFAGIFSTLGVLLHLSRR